MKDVTFSQVIKVAINSQLKEYGKMLKLNLDSTKKSIEMEVMLDGEREALALHIKKYEIIEEDGKYLLKIYDVTTSRAWINVVASSYLEGRAFEIPAEYAKMLKVIV